ncbi:MAG: hypothetical protein ACPGLY_25435 [Rubripirellula sp.]
MKSLSLALLSLVLIAPTTAKGQEDDDAKILFADGTSYYYDEEFREWRDKTGG